jgi:hypothetical protein
MLNSLKSCEFVINLKEAYKRKEKVYFIFEYVERVRIGCYFSTLLPSKFCINSQLNQSNRIFV